MCDDEILGMGLVIGDVNGVAQSRDQFTVNS
jgi:hypothetical protein